MDQVSIFNTENGKNNLSKYIEDQDSIHSWANKYYLHFVVNSPIHTQRAKKGDLLKFLSYLTEVLRTNSPDSWTPSTTRGFQNYLTEQKYPKTNLGYIATTINRILATLRHFGNWLHKERKLMAGNPFAQVKMIQVEEPSWNGLTALEVTRLKSACDFRMNACTKNNQNPQLEKTVFYILLTTGLRESELARLDYGQYYARGFHNVTRKGSKVTKKVPLPAEPREFLDEYLKTRKNLQNSDPLITSKYGNRISTRDIARICERIAKQAAVQFGQDEKIKLSPHMLRHTFLKRVADKHGVHAAQDLSGNISMREIFRYTKPNYEQKHNIVEALY
jgi:integrase/recombinase XerD